MAFDTLEDLQSSHWKVAVMLYGNSMVPGVQVFIHPNTKPPADF